MIFNKWRERRNLINISIVYKTISMQKWTLKVNSQRNFGPFWAVANLEARPADELAIITDICPALTCRAGRPSAISFSRSNGMRPVEVPVAAPSFAAPAEEAVIFSCIKIHRRYEKLWAYCRIMSIFRRIYLLGIHIM